MILFRKCLKYDVIQFAVEDNLEWFYHRGLKESMKRLPYGYPPHCPAPLEGILDDFGIANRY